MKTVKFHYSQVLSYYPEELRGDLCLHLHREVLSLPLFQAAPQGCLKSISLTIKTSFCAPDEYLVHAGDVVSTIYYISSGSMEVVQDGMVVALLGRQIIFFHIKFSMPSADSRRKVYHF